MNPVLEWRQHFQTAWKHSNTMSQMNKPTSGHSCRMLSSPARHSYYSLLSGSAQVMMTMLQQQWNMNLIKCFSLSSHCGSWNQKKPAINLSRQHSFEQLLPLCCQLAWLTNTHDLKSKDCCSLSSVGDIVLPQRLFFRLTSSPVERSKGTMTNTSPPTRGPLHEQQTLE